MQKFLSSLMLACTLTASVAAFTQDQMSQDSMKKDDSKQDTMKNDQMKKETKSKKTAKKVLVGVLYRVTGSPKFVPCPLAKGRGFRRVQVVPRSVDR